MKKKTIIEMGWTELEKLVKEHYGFDYDFVAGEEASNDSVTKFTVAARMDGMESEEWDRIEISKGHPSTTQYNAYILLGKLAEDGHLEPGEYLIRVCW
jgi:hypothetical protein